MELKQIKSEFEYIVIEKIRNWTTTGRIRQ